MKIAVISIFGFFVFCSLVLARGVFADGNCTPIYGGGQTCQQASNMVLNKTVQNPQTGIFVNNLSVNDPKFSSDQTVAFQIAVTNTGGSAINAITVKDTLPQFVTDFSGSGNPAGVANNSITFTLSNLSPNETRTTRINLKVVGASSLPATITCVVNQATATSDSGQTSSANSQFCIQKLVVQFPPTTKGGLPLQSAPNMTTTPPTGPEALGLLALLPTGALGAFLRKKTSSQ